MMGLQNVKEVLLTDVVSNWVLYCPFCSSLARIDAQSNECIVVLHWNKLQNSWVFFCDHGGSPKYSGIGNTLDKFLGALGDDFAENYRKERRNSGATGKGHN